MGTKAVSTMVGVQRLPQSPKRDIGTLAKTSVENEVAFGCVEIRASSLATPRLIVQKRTKDGEWEEAEGHPFRRLWIRPSEGMGEADLIRFASRSFDATGLFYAEKVRSRSGALVGLNPLDPEKVQPVYKKAMDGSREIDFYRWRDGIYTSDIAPDDMLLRRDVMLGGGQSRLGVAMAHIDADNAQTDYVRAFFNNAGVPSGILNVKDRTIDQEESDAIRSQWRAKYGRQWGNQHDVAVLDENADYQKVGSGLDELDSETLRGVSESRICTVFEVPPLIIYTYIGLTRSTYSNMDSAWEQFWKTTMSGLMRDWKSWLSYAVLSEFVDFGDVLDEKIRLHWDTSEVGALNEAVTELADREKSIFMVNATTLDEFRARLGLAPYPDAALGGLNYAQIEGMSQVPLAVQEPTKALTRSFKMQNKTEEQEQAALERYREQLEALAKQARNGEIEQEEFEQKLLDLAVSALLIMFLLGSLIRRNEVTDAERLALVPHIEAHQQSVGNLANDIYDGRYESDEKMTGRLALWVGGAARVLTMARTWRRDDPLQQWRRSPNKDSCTDCIERDGVTKRASEWRNEDKLPKSTALACHGDHCGCDLYEVV